MHANMQLLMWEKTEAAKKMTLNKLVVLDVEGTIRDQIRDEKTKKTVCVQTTASTQPEGLTL